MKAIWYKGCKSKEEKDTVRQSLLASRGTLEALSEILESMLKETPASTDYDNPSWAYKQADRLGHNRALNQVLDLINLDKE